MLDLSMRLLVRVLEAMSLHFKHTWGVFVARGPSGAVVFPRFFEVCL